MNTNIISISTTFNDIPHLATTLWFSGCNLKCKGCQNTILENRQDGLNLNELVKVLEKRVKMTDWLVYLGGNPLDSIESLLKVSTLAKDLGFKQFLYSGYTYYEFENMFNNNIHNMLINNFNYIKTGRYDINYSKQNCSIEGEEYFFETLNQEVYKSNNYSWEKFYNFDFDNNLVYGNLSLI